MRFFEKLWPAGKTHLPDRAPVPLIWMLGKTGSGKTSIIRLITGADDAVIGGGYRPETKLAREFCFPDQQAALVRFLDTPGLGEAGRGGNDTDELAQHSDQADLVIVTVRLTDQATASLLQVIKRVRKLRPDRPVLLVITAIHDACPGMTQFDPHLLDDLTDDMLPEQISRPLRAHLDRFNGLYDDVVAVDLTRPEDGFLPSDLGGPRLFDAIMAAVPAAMRLTLGTMRKLRSDLRNQAGNQTETMILAHCTLAAGAAAVPVVWIDLPVVLGIQTHLAHRIAKQHGQTLTPAGVAQLSAVLGGRAAVRIALRGFTKLIPVVGSAINSAAAFCMVYAAGKVLDWYFTETVTGRVPSQHEIAQIYHQQIDAARRYWTSRRLGESGQTGSSGSADSFGDWS